MCNIVPKTPNDKLTRHRMCQWWHIHAQPCCTYTCIHFCSICLLNLCPFSQYIPPEIHWVTQTYDTASLQALLTCVGSWCVFPTASCQVQCQENLNECLWKAVSPPPPYSGSFTNIQVAFPNFHLTSQSNTNKLMKIEKSGFVQFSTEDTSGQTCKIHCYLVFLVGRCEHVHISV